MIINIFINMFENNLLKGVYEIGEGLFVYR